MFRQWRRHRGNKTIGKAADPNAEEFDRPKASRSGIAASYNRGAMDQFGTITASFNISQGKD